MQMTELKKSSSVDTDGASEEAHAWDTINIDGFEGKTCAAVPGGCCGLG